MKIVIVTSQANYVKDNYLQLIDRITAPENLPAGVEIAGVIFIKTVNLKIFLKAAALLTIGAPDTGGTLLNNMLDSLFFDKRKEILKKRNIPYFLYSTINSKEAIDTLAGIKPDLIINVRTRDIYKKEALALPAIGCINVHHGILPDNRGTMCDLWAWVEGRPVGFSIHQMNEKIDDGNIITVKTVSTEGVKSYIEIPMRSSLIEADAILETIKKINETGKIEGFPNKTENKKHTRNPDVSKIKELRKRGFYL
ncbi:MAG: formyltransferase family protein [Candidatus Wallbacteria bacterium]